MIPEGEERAIDPIASLGCIFQVNAEAATLFRQQFLADDFCTRT